jgi:hypothetical protein
MIHNRALAFSWPYQKQDEQLYVSDPRALQSIVLKDQDAFEETAVFVELVVHYRPEVFGI